MKFFTLLMSDTKSILPPPPLIKKFIYSISNKY